MSAERSPLFLEWNDGRRTDVMVNVLEQVKSGATRFFGSLDDAWRSWMARSGQALTRFTRREDDAVEDDSTLQSWGIVAGEVAETAKDVVVRLEAPGMDKDDFEVRVEHGSLRVRGEKRFEQEERGASYHLFESAYGAFERILPLPCEVDAERSEASYRRGILTVRLPKTKPTDVRKIPIG
jgi:HSP20 family protein